VGQRIQRRRSHQIFKQRFLQLQGAGAQRCRLDGSSGKRGEQRLDCLRREVLNGLQIVTEQGFTLNNLKRRLTIRFDIEHMITARLPINRITAVRSMCGNDDQIPRREQIRFAVTDAAGLPLDDGTDR